jgi:TonB family protein
MSLRLPHCLLSIVLVAAALGLPSAPDLAAQPAEQYVVIVNPANPSGGLGSALVSELFLKKKVRWESGETVEPIDLSGEPEVRDAFSRDMHGKTTANIRSYWNQVVFSGRATPPLELATSGAVVEYVRSHQWAIGYVSPRAPLDGVKQINITILPSVVQRVEPRYPPAALAARKSGDVVLSVEVTKTGSAGKITPLRELGFGLTAEAIRAVRMWKFEPGKRDGLPVTQEIQVTVTFAPPQ